MKIIILGAGQVGTTVAHKLVTETDNDITVVDNNEAVLGDLEKRLDLGTVHGSGAFPNILREAGADDADMLIAVTDSDEVNIVACQIAHALFHTPTKIARVRASEYLAAGEIFQQGALGIDRLISPEQLVTDYISRLMNYPGALQVLDFADGKVRLVAVEAYYGGPLVGKQLRALRDHVPQVEARVAAIYRRGQPIIPTGDTVIEADDEVFFIAARRDIRTVISELRKLDKPIRRVIIAGAGNIGVRLADALEDNHNVKLIERNRDRARKVSELLDNTIVLNGDAADEELLREESIENVDVFCGVTNAEEANILSAMLAKRLGARKVLALINRPAYVDLVQSGSIDIALSPQQVTIGALLTYIRRGDVLNVHSLRGGAAEAIEAVAHGGNGKSRVVGRRVDEIDLPPGATMSAIVRGDEVLMAHDDIVIENGDHVILFVIERKHIAAVEKLFQVGVDFV
ncbi:MAG TPA: Trk system potassium transporter TrkA [Gammaproteobacteria bacterium]|nr:Trk system potassium transporter TrkA [Gammaproteobacteria bacterium]